MKKRSAVISIAIGLIAALVLAVILIPQKEDKPMDTNLTVTSPAFADGGDIPARYAATGEEVSPPLAIGGLPSGAVSVAVIMDDIDAPVIGTVYHWVLWNIPPTTEIPEDVPREKELPSLGGACQGRNTMFRIGYMGPNPPSGIHRYRIHVYALDTMLDLAPGAGHRKLEKAMEGHILGYGILSGRFSK